MGKRTINWDSDEDFIKKYKELKSSEKMAKFYNCNKTSILNHCKEIGFDYKTVQEYKLSEKDKQEIIDSYELYTSNYLAEKYNVSRGMITKLWYDNNLKNKKITYKGKYDLTGLIFERLTVLSKTNKRNAGGSVLYDCLCECGNHILADATLLKNGKIKSCGCLNKEIFLKNRIDNFKDLTGKTYGNLIVIERDFSKKDKRCSVFWKCKCSCGRITTVSGNNLKRENTQSCGFCKNNSHGNAKIEKLLKENNILFEREKRFETCKDLLMLPFDFYVNNKYLIEYDGKQHFDKDNSKLFYNENIEKHDKIKNNWCKENNIPLIRIPYTHYHNLTIKDLLLETSDFII